MERVLKYLGLARRANLLAVGEEDSGAAVRGGKGKLLLLASDASDNARARAEGFIRERKTVLLTLPCDKASVSHAVGKNGCSMVTVMDIGLASSIVSVLAELDAEAYGAAAETLRQRNAKAVQRKRESAAHDKNKRTGKRRKANGQL